MVAGDSDFAADFNFDFKGLSVPTQAAWEFTGALKQAKAELSDYNKNRATSIDQKIKGRVDARHAAKEQKKAAKAIGRAPPGRRGQPADSEDEEDEEDEESDEDAPLPGELDDEDEDDEDVEADGDQEEEDGGLGGDSDDDSLEDGEDDEEEEDEDEEEEEEPAPPAVKPGKAQAGARQAAAAAPAAAAGGKGSAAAAPPAQGKQKQQAQQPRKGQQNGGHHPQEEAEEEEEGEQDEATRRQQKGAGTSGSGGGGGEFYAQLPDGTSFKAASFGDLNLSRPLTKACAMLGYTTPTPIQAAVIPLALAGRDICGSAVTGSGKTAAFALPCLERLLHRQRSIAATYVLVLTPTRELAVQIHSMVTKLAQFTDVSVALVVGGLSSQVQASVLRRSPEVVVATPGRLIDHLRNTQSVGLEDLAVLVLDEADRLLEMGFKDEVQEIVKMAPRKRQTMLFSATFNEEVRRLMALSLKQPVRLAADPSAAVPRDLRQEVVRFKGAAAAATKEASMLALCARSFKAGHAIIFFKTKQRAHRAKILFGLLGLPPAAELHGDMTQAARLQSLEDFRAGKAAFLLATDVAARGLDIQGVQVVLNYDAPRKLETHLHRIGRTARAGASGMAVTFIEDQDRQLLKEVIKKTKATMGQRVVPEAAVAAWQARVENAEGDVSKIYAQEREEREMRRAEMEATKAQNLLEHEAEIKARPQRTWFQSERQKKDVARRAAMEAAGQDDELEDEERQSRDKAAAKQEAKNKRREKRKLEAAAAENGGKRQKDALMEETGVLTKQIRSTKSRLRALKQQGISGSKAVKILGAQAAGVKKSKGAKKGGAAKKQLFAGDGTGRPGGEGGSGGGAGGASSGGSPAAEGKYLRDRSSLSKTELARVKRGGAGKRAFKSKARFKRKKR